MRSPTRSRRSRIWSRCATFTTGSTPVVLRPGSVDEVAAILKLANETKTAIVPQGGNTGLVGGQIPHHGEVRAVADAARQDPRGRCRLQHDDGGSRRHAAARARGGGRRRPALSATAAVGRHLHHRRQSFDQCRRRRRDRPRHRALACARARSGARRRPGAAQPQQAEEGQYRLRSAQPVHRRGRHARHHHGGGVAAGAAAALDRNRLRRGALAAGCGRSARHRDRAQRRAASPRSS